MSAKKLHTINELPHIYELEDMMGFCEKYSKIYIYGIAINQEMLLKYFDMCDVKIMGYVVTWYPEKICFSYREMPVRLMEDVIEEEETGIIVALSDRYFQDIIPRFREKQFNDYFIMSEFNKRAIANQVRPRKREKMAFEVNLADHCNMSCQMCDHYSQLSEPCFLDFEQFQKDIKRLGELYDHDLSYITLLGGEPLLNHDIIRIIKVTREAFPNTNLYILTNGILLMEWENMPEGNLWEACKEYDVGIWVTVYPIKLDYTAIEKKAEEYGVSLTMSSNIHAESETRSVKISDKHTLDLNKSVHKFYCISCLYYNKFNVLKDGRIYMCPVAAHSKIFNDKFGKTLELLEEDSINIYKIDSWKDIAKFSSSYVPFCSYCDLKHWGPHSEWKSSTKQIDEYV